MAKVSKAGKLYKKTKFLLLVILVILILFGIYLGEKFLAWDNTTSFSGKQMKLYEDPDKYFSINLPSTWQVTNHQVGTFTTGPDNDHLNPYDVELFAFKEYPANDSASGNKPVLYVEVWRKGQCLDNNASNTTLGGLPAYYDGTSMYEINNNSASFRLYVYIPGIVEKNFSELEGNLGGPLMRIVPPTPTATPQNLIAQNRTFMQQIISSFKTASAIRASCSNEK